MNVKDEDLPALQELESAVIAVWIRRPEMSDYAAGRAYEAAHQMYRSRLRNREPKPPNLTGVDAETFGVVLDVCEKIHVTGAEPMNGLPEGNTKPVAPEKLVEYLRELQRSVERHTAAGGRQGYLQFVRDHLG
jgi:hypothetical protein